MQKCPNCAEESISNMSKFMLGPARSITCSNCGARISISWWYLASMLIFIIPFGYFIHSNQSDLSLVILIISVIVHLFVQIKYVPLVVRKSDFVIR